MQSQNYKHFILFLLITVFINLNTYHSMSFAQTTGSKWYVNKMAAGANNGITWTDAWTSFGAINWASVQPGDTIFISGGTTSLTYNETLNIGKSGSSGSPIVITKGLSTGHNGNVVIDGQGTLSYNIQNNSYQYVNVENLDLRNATAYNYRLRNSNNVVKACTLYVSSGATAGIDVRGSNNIIEYNVVTTSSGLNDGQRDFVQATTGGGHIFRNNWIRIDNTDIDDHTDIFQFYGMASSCEIYNNFYWQNNTKTTNAQGIYMTTSNITLTCYNNVAYFPYAKSAIGINNVGGYTGKVIAYGNTFYQGSGSLGNCIWLSTPAPNNIIKNNILYSASSTAAIYLGSGATGDVIDNNLLYSAGSYVGFYNGSSKTWTQWNALGFDTNGLNTNPLFNNIGTQDLTLQAGSAAIDEGVTLGGPYSLDIDGVSRPQGAGYDLGAYERVSGGGGGNNPPNQPTGENPTSGSTGQPINLTLTWTCTDPDGDPLTYDIYFGMSSNPTLAASNLTSANYTPEQLNNNTTYYWKIIAKDNQGATTTGSVFSFTTLSSDVTAPEVVGAELTSSTNLVINFSETLNSSTAQNENNYIISNGITVSSAVLSSTQVTLLTSEHVIGAYTVTVDNVTDLAGNIINPLYNTADYESTIDVIPPYFKRLTVTSSKTIIVNFSETMDPVEAKNISNYSINNNIVIFSVQLLPDSMSIRLNTSHHSNSVDYTLTISNITDRAGNIISPNPKSVVYRRSNRGIISTQNSIKSVRSNDWDPNYLPEKTIDGRGMINPDSRWMGLTAMPDTLSLDLGNIHTIDSLRISFYQWDSDRLYKYSLLSSVDSVIWESVVLDIWSDSLEWTNIEFDSTQARFVKLILLQSNQNQPASIWEIELYGPAGVTGINNGTEIPNTYTLSQNYPNPFNPATTINYTVPEKSQVSLKIFDVLGAEVVELVNSELEPGAYKIDFNASGLPSGVYFYRLETKSFVETKKMILLK